MKTKFFTTVILITIAMCGIAQKSVLKTVIQKDSKGNIHYIEYSKEDQSVNIPKTAEEFFKNVLNIQKADYFERKPNRSDREGYVHELFDQYYNGVKVEGAGYNFHYYNGVMYFAHGNYVKMVGFNTKPTISAEEAKNTFANYKKIPVDSVIRYYSDLIIKEIPLKNETLLFLVYRIRLISDHPDNIEIGIVDAQTGSILITEPAICNAAAVGTFATRYSGSRQAHTDRITNNYILFNDTRGANIYTRNLNSNTNITNCVELIDNNNDWTTAEHGPNNNDMALDVHWALQQIYDRLYYTHGKNSFDNNGFRIHAYIKYGNTAYHQDNSFWDLTEKVLLFGVGNTIFYPVVSLDMVAHEFGHGITDYQIGWNYNTFGEFHEGMSDIWSAIMKYRITPNQPTWRVGNQIQQNSSFNCERNLQDTKNLNARTKMENTFGTISYNGSSDIYFKSGVFSHWFYLLSSGGSGVNGLSNNYSAIGVGMDVAEKLIVEAVYSGYLRNTASYAAIRTSFKNAAMSLEGNQYGLLAQKVENAWYAVGVGSQPTLTTISGLPDGILLPSYL